MKCLNNQKGFALVTTYLLFAVLTIGASATFTRSYVYMREAEKHKNAIIALEMAEAGVDQAITQLASNTAYAGASYADFSSGSAKGGYTITVSTPSGAPSSVRQISVMGYSPSNTESDIGYKNSSLNVYTQFQGGNYFMKAIFANDSYSNVGNGTTDSYDSRIAPYDPSAPGSNGDVGTNGTGAGDISLTGNAVINGSVIVGMSGDPSTVVVNSGSATVTGTSTASASVISLPAPTTSLPSSGALSISGSTAISLSAGTYHYSSLSISGNGSLATAGEVTIYVSGSVSIAGNGTSAYGSLPQNLKIYVTTNDSVSVMGNGTTYAAIYAPLSAVSVGGNGEVFGAIVGDTVSMNGNADFHYDEALEDVVDENGGGAEILAWVQNGNGAWTD